MTFQYPWWLLALLAVPVFAAGLASFARDRRRAARAFSDPDVMDVRPPRRVRRLRTVAGALALLAVALGAVAMARPSVERTTNERRPSLVVAIDVSQSMLKSDVEPDRLEAGKDALRRLLEVAPKESAIGLLTFSDSARALVAPTTDRRAVRKALDTFEIREGTAIGEAVVSGIDLLRAAGAVAPAASTEPAPGRVLLLTDGAQSAGSVSPQSAGERARAARVPISAILLGSDAGRPDEDPPDVVLASLARRTGGVFTRSTSADDLRSFFEDIGATLTEVTRQEELTVYVALTQVVLLLAAGGALLAGSGMRRARPVRGARPA